MLLNRGSEAVRDQLADGDPLPPDNRVVPECRIDQAYRGQRPRLLRFLSRQAPRCDADDLVQQTFVRVLTQQAETPVSIVNPAAFLVRVARNLAINHNKAEQVRANAAHLSLDALDMSGPDQIAVLEARDMLRRLESVLAKLKPRTREIFLAHRFDGYSYSEIAALTGLSVKGVEKHMSQAIAHVARNMRTG